MPMLSIPVIDLATDDARCRESIDSACREWGFFQVVGHGLPDAALGELQRHMRAFFALPRQRRQAFLRSREDPWGYYDRELTKNRRDWKEIFDIPKVAAGGPFADASLQWPDELHYFRETMMAHLGRCEALARRLIGILASSLGAEPAALEREFDRDTSFLRLNYYPLCADPAAPDADFVPQRGQLGISHHTDAGALTVLHQGKVAGLQVHHGGVWRVIEPVEGALVINIGDVVQVWSNDAYTAPLHRVLANSNEERLTAAYFYNPSYETNYAPLAHLGPPRYAPISWKAFRAGRAQGDYADVGDEIQISHFRL